MKPARENWIESKRRRIDDGMTRGDNKKTLTKTDWHKILVTEDSNGHFLTFSTELTERLSVAKTSMTSS